MKQRIRAGLLYWLALCLLLMMFFSFYQAIDRGVTAEEGLRYTVPHLPKAKPDFEKMSKQADHWMEVTGILLVLSIASAAGGSLMRRRGLR